jgi:ribosomal protein S4
MKIKLLLCILAGLTVPISYLMGDGILFVKPQAWSDPTTASAVPYKSFEIYPAGYTIVSLSGQTQHINAGLVTENIDFSPYKLSENITSDQEKVGMRENAVKLTSLVKSKPRVASYLNSLLQAYKDAEAALLSGKVRVNGVWINSDEYAKQQSEKKKAAEESEQTFMAQQAQRRKNERAELEVQNNAVIKDISDLEVNLATYKKELDEKTQSSSSGYKHRRFIIQRKLPKADFAELYDISNYVYESLTEGDEKCVLVSHSIATMEDRLLLIWVKYYSDMDVVMRNGNSERIPVFVQAESDVNNILEKISAISTRLEGQQTKLKTLQRELQRGETE